MIILKRYKKLKLNLLKCKKKFIFFKSNYNIGEQFKLVNNLDIMNRPKTVDESLFDITLKLSSLLNTVLNEVDINKIYRVKTRNNDTSRIIVEFNDKKQKR